MTGSRRTDSARWAAAACSIILLPLAAACSTDGGAESDWFRDYVSTYERVFDAAQDAVDDTGFYLDEVDAERGRIVARSSARRRDLEASLFVDVRTRGDRVRVGVMVQSRGLEDGRAPTPVSGVVADFLSNLDARLEGRED